MLSAFRAERGREPGIAERQLLQAMASLESSYGEGWKGHGVGSNNWGAVVAKPGEPFFVSADSRPVGDRQATYETRFKKYATPAAGARDVVRVCYSYRGAEAAAAGGDALAFAKALFRPRPGREVGYYAGLAMDPPDRRPVRRAAGLVRQAIGIARQCGENVLAYGTGAPDTLRRDDPRVAAIEALGGMTVEEYQRSRGLKSDGVIGPNTWSWLLIDPERKA